VKFWVTMVFLCGGLFLGPSALALEMIPVAGVDITADFEQVYTKVGRIGYVIKGASFSEEGEAVSGLHWLMKREDKLLRAFLIWGGGRPEFRKISCKANCAPSPERRERNIRG